MMKTKMRMRMKKKLIRMREPRALKKKKVLRFEVEMKDLLRKLEIGVEKNEA